MKTTLKNIARPIFYLGISLMLVISISDVWIESTTKDLTFDTLENLPSKKVAIVLGTSAKGRFGSPNYYFVHRMEAAAKLYFSGKVEYIIVSGDNSRKEYDESTDMKNDLIARGIPADKIYVDYAGFRTLDSVVRCQDIFGTKDLIIVSQEFHNQRAIFLASHHGLRAHGYNARDLSVRAGIVVQLREKLARVKAVLDVIVHKKPKFSGDPIVVGVDQPI
ncbi:MAG: SanA protein [Bacteroidia bacterium]|jgi:SanA protein